MPFLNVRVQATAVLLGSLLIAGCPQPKGTVCSKPEIACTSGDVCASAVCNGGCCIPKAGATCSSNADCPIGDACQDGTCQPVQTSSGCTDDSECSGSTPYCVSASCVACRSASDCGANQVCNSQSQCAYTNGYCMTNSDCVQQSSSTPICNTQFQLCVGCLQNTDCPDGGSCDPETETCGGATTCSSDTDCSTNANDPRCDTDTGMCVQCLTTGDCGTGTCVNNVCVIQEMDGGVDAGTDAGIDAGEDAGVDAGIDAGVDAGIDAGVDAGIDAGTDAGTGTTDGGSGGCTSNTNCAAPTPVCDTTTGQCVQCMQTLDCANPGTDTCQDNVCTTAQTCTSTSQCTTPDDTFCDHVTGTCQECGSNSACPSGEDCYQGFCAALIACTADSDCSGGACSAIANANYESWDLICYDPDTAGAQGKGGAPCTTNDDCFSGFCVVYGNASDTITGGVCIDGCTSASDCAPGAQCPSGGLVFLGMTGPNGGDTYKYFPSTDVCWTASCQHDSDCAGVGPGGANWYCSLTEASVSGTGNNATVNSWIESCLPPIGTTAGGGDCALDTDCESGLCISGECFDACTKASNCSGGESCSALNAVTSSGTTIKSCY